MIEYKVFGEEQMESVNWIYWENHWECYTECRFFDERKTYRAFEKSLYVLGAFDDDELVGFVRCVGDGEFILLIQDIIVRPSYQRRGIGRELIRRVFMAFPLVHTCALLADQDDKIGNAFFQAVGMSRLYENKYPIIPYYRVYMPDNSI